MYTGFTLHRVTEKIDCGEILYQDRISVEDVKDEAALDSRIALRASRTFERYLDYLSVGGEWEKKEIDAFKIYRNHVGYATFANRVPK